MAYFRGTQISDSVVSETKRICQNKGKLTAIKYLRDKTGLGLKDAKDFVESNCPNVGPTSNSKKSGCYVATCVYGSYDCPEVWTLRRYRDDTLGKTWYGRLFIRTYYAISPAIVKLFGNTKWFKKMWRSRLDRMVENLQKKGVENTPYIDKQW